MRKRISVSGLAARLCALVAVLSLSACIPVYMLPAKQYPAKPSSVIVVGKFEVSPAINVDFEQTGMEGVWGTKHIQNHLVMATSKFPARVNPETMQATEWKDAISGEFGKTFMVKGPRQQTFLRGGAMMADLQKNSRVWFPADKYYDVPANATAVYIGTIRYTRGDFFEIKRVQVIDHYRQALQEFRARFGPNAVLTKSLLK